jgi:uncharacterized integral membrane protein (TIGR00698 family)
MRVADIAAWFKAQSGKFPGVLVCATIALAATFVSENYGGPQLLYALLLGLSFHFLMDDARMKHGIDFCSRTVLRLGVALLGARITLPQIAKLGLAPAVMVTAAVASTILFGLLLARLLHRPREEGILSGGAVAICGASAALAISSVLPQTRENERYTLLAVVGVTLLSTVAMILYPFAARGLGLDAVQAGLFFGGTIHDVAQVVAAGLMLSPETGDTATIVKLFRVLLLVPVVFILALAYRRQAGPVRAGGARQPLVPPFLIGFALLVLLSSVGAIDASQIKQASAASRAMLVIAIAAVGVKTSFQDLGKLGWLPVAMMLAETLFIAAFVLTVMLGFG